MISNLKVYRAIAEEALAESQRIYALHTSPKPNGAVGSVKTFDFSQASFKQAMVCIVFSGIYLEALLWIEGSKRFGDEYKSIDRLEYEKRLPRFGINATSLLLAAERFRKARIDLVHEKAAPVDRIDVFRFAQKEARLGLELVRQITDELNR